MSGHRFGHGSYALEDSASAFGIRDLEPILLVERDDQLESIHGVEAQAAGAEERLLIADFVGGDLQHEVLDHHLLDIPFECPVRIHQ